MTVRSECTVMISLRDTVMSLTDTQIRNSKDSDVRPVRITVVILIHPTFSPASRTAGLFSSAARFSTSGANQL
jgi:hypothetical protein